MQQHKNNSILVPRTIIIIIIIVHACLHSMQCNYICITINIIILHNLIINIIIIIVESELVDVTSSKWSSLRLAPISARNTQK